MSGMLLAVHHPSASPTGRADAYNDAVLKSNVLRLAGSIPAALLLVFPPTTFLAKFAKYRLVEAYEIRPGTLSRFVGRSRPAFEG
jgi:hypothetical protein